MRTINLFLYFVVYLSCIHISLARLGVDLSVETFLPTWECLVSQHNISFAKIRVYRNIGVVDENSVKNIKLANLALRSKNVDAYIFPCIQNSAYAVSKNITCSSPRQQISDIIDFLEINDIYFSGTMDKKVEFEVGRLWFDIEDEVPSKYYDSNITFNINFIEEMTNELNKRGVAIGIYTTKTYWTNIMGGVLGYSQYPLWYPRYDGYNNMSFYSPFAGWDTVNIKQTGGNVRYCNISQVDSDYMLD